MARRYLALLGSVALMTGGLAMTTSSSAATTFKFCGDTVKVGAGSYNVRAKGIGCAKARRVAKAYFPGGREILGFSCTSTSVGLELSRARCVRNSPSAVVKFQFGA